MVLEYRLSAIYLHTTATNYEEFECASPMFLRHKEVPLGEIRIRLKKYNYL